MRLVAGSYPHAENEAAVTIAKSRTRNEAQQSIEEKVVWTITGQVHGTDQATTTAAVRALESAYAQDYIDLVLYLDDGSTIAHQLRNAGSTSGVLITQPPSFPVGQGAENSTFRTYTITAEASYALEPQGDSNDEQLLTFTETVQISGGGPVYAWFEGTTGAPERQKVRERSLCRVSQSGQATAKRGYPRIPSPIFPEWLIADPVFGYTSPQLRGTTFENYGVSWQYEFAAPSRLDGRPHQWGG